jgi:hypothetical protein
VLYVPFLLGGATLVAGGVWALRNARASTNWPTATGTVISSEIREISQGDSRYGAYVTYRAKILYDYSVGGVTYSSTTVSFVEQESSLSDARGMVDRYPEGKRVEVYYDPLRPEVSVLEPGAATAARVIVCAGVFVILVGGYGGAVSNKRPRKKRRK